jgi:Uma2 family endonuclease
MAETDWHRDLMLLLIQTLKTHYAGQPRVYVSGNLLVFYEPGNKRRHVSPDVFVVKGVANHPRPNYLVWEERKGPTVVIELTSSSTRREDVETKYRLYQDVLRVREYFLFDPRGDYRDPPLRGYRLRRGLYQPVRPVAGRLPSQVLGLHLERRGEDLRLFNPGTGQWLPTPVECVELEQAARRRAEEVANLEQAARRQAEQRAEGERAARSQAEAEVERLRRELEQLRRNSSQGPV